MKSVWRKYKGVSGALQDHGVNWDSSAGCGGARLGSASSLEGTGRSTALQAAAGLRTCKRAATNTQSPTVQPALEEYANANNYPL